MISRKVILLVVFNFCIIVNKKYGIRDNYKDLKCEKKICKQNDYNLKLPDKNKLFTLFCLLKNGDKNEIQKHFIVF